MPGFFFEILLKSNSELRKSMRSSSKDVRFVVVATLIGVLSALCLLPGLYGNFIFDDSENIVSNAALHIRSLTLENLLHAAYSFQPGHGTRALSMLSFAIDFWRGGLDPSVFRSTNIVIHAITTIVLAYFLRTILVAAQSSTRHATASALCIAAVWAMHPLNVSSVLYIVQRMQTLVTLFMLLAMWAYVRMRLCQIEGLRSRQFAVLVGLFWVLGFAAKEDAVLFPAYAMALEITLFQFRASNERLAILIRRAFLAMVIFGTATYLFIVVPHYWTWEPYPVRTFSTPERLLTQGRVLIMHIGQTLLPLPDSMPFFYDDYEISKGWLKPATTLFTWLLIVVLLSLAWCLRSRRPIFSFGILLYFFGHFLTSNVLNLELVFEHRNHLPMIGVLLSAADMVVLFGRKLRIPDQFGLPFSALLVFLLGCLTAYRAYNWGDPVRFATATLKAAPHSERAWISLVGAYVDRSKFEPNEDLAHAIELATRGSKSVEDPTLLLANLLIYKTVMGTVQESDWALFLEHFRIAPMNAQNRRIVWNFINNSNNGSAVMNEAHMLDVIDVSNARAPFDANQNLQAGAYIFNQTLEPRRALPYLVRAVELSPKEDTDVLAMIKRLRELGKLEWATKLEEVRLKNDHLPGKIRNR